MTRAKLSQYTWILAASIADTVPLPLPTASTKLQLSEMLVCWGTGCIKCMEDSKMGLKGLGEKWGSIVDAIQELPAVIRDGNKQ